jgi:hypothetical protein
VRTCVWEHRFSAELKRIEPDPKRADDLVAGIDWVLARDPKAGVSVPGTQVWYIVSRDIKKNRHLLIYFTFTDQEVFFLSAIQSPIPH